ncbi:MAG: hypothetical protein ACKV0T_22230 [Planctomycetales bacterium]
MFGFPNDSLPLKRAVTIAGLLLVLTAAALGGHHRMKARRHCGIPGEYAYGVVAAKPPARAVSSTATLLRGDSPATTPNSAATLPGATATAVKSYQLESSSLQVDHCAISRLAVLLDRNGRCRISMQVDQNTKETAARAANPRPNDASQQISNVQTNHQKRNEFHVVVRGYGNSPLKEDPASVPLGKPLVFRVEVCPFWVQNGESRDVVVEVPSDNVREYFDLVDRLEVDFWYR